MSRRILDELEEEAAYARKVLDEAAAYERGIAEGEWYGEPGPSWRG